MKPDLTVGQALRQGIELLAAHAVPEPRLTAEVLLAHALARDRTWLYAHPEYQLSEVQWVHYGRYLYDRQNGKPTQYITRVQEFYGRPFYVTPDVLIPRPETEHVVEAVLQLQPPPGRILDLGTGSGAIAVSVALELARPVFASDISLNALEIARENARRLGARVEFLCLDSGAALQGMFQVIAANPPYVPEGEIAGLQREIRDFEPRVALDGGADGLNVYRKIIADAERLLVPTGHLVVEIGYRSERPLRQLLSLGAWDAIITKNDLAGLPRVMVIRRK